jgi:hypothetical protein
MMIPLRVIYIYIYIYIYLCFLWCRLTLPKCGKEDSKMEKIKEEESMGGAGSDEPVPQEEWKVEERQNVWEVR